jgi:hypothetical protein
MPDTHTPSLDAAMPYDASALLRQPHSVLPPIFPSMLTGVRVRQGGPASTAQAVTGGSSLTPGALPGRPLPPAAKTKGASAPNPIATTAEALLPEWLGGAGGIDARTFRELSLHPFLLLPLNSLQKGLPSEREVAPGADSQMLQKSRGAVHSDTATGNAGGAAWWDEMLEKHPSGSPLRHQAQAAPGPARRRPTPQPPVVELARGQADLPLVSTKMPTTNEPVVVGIHVQCSYSSTPRRKLEASSGDDEAGTQQGLGARRYDARRRLSQRIQLCKEGRSSQKNTIQRATTQGGDGAAVPGFGDSDRRLQELWVDEMPPVSESMQPKRAAGYTSTKPRYPVLERHAAAGAAARAGGPRF